MTIDIVKSKCIPVIQYHYCIKQIIEVEQISNKGNVGIGRIAFH